MVGSYWKVTLVWAPVSALGLCGVVVCCGVVLSRGVVVAGSVGRGSCAKTINRRSRLGEQYNEYDVFLLPRRARLSRLARRTGPARLARGTGLALATGRARRAGRAWFC